MTGVQTCALPICIPNVDMRLAAFFGVRSQGSSGRAILVDNAAKPRRTENGVHHLGTS